MTQNERVEGYSLLSRYMAKHQNPTFRLFQPLAARDLLFRQAELIHLDKEYQELEKQSRASGDEDLERYWYDRDWRLLSTADKRPFYLDLEKGCEIGGCGKQWSKALEIRAKLKDYYSALNLYSQVAAIPQPTGNDIHRLKEFMARPDLGGGCCFVGDDLHVHSSSNAYSEENEPDLISLAKTPREDDIFTKFLAGPVASAYFRVFHHLKTPEPYDEELPMDISPGTPSRMYVINKIRLHAIIDILGTISSSLAPLSSIVVLYFVQNESIRLGIVCGFTIIFTIILALATKARRVEIFAATAAFAGIQVVFIGSTTGSITQSVGGSSN